MDKFAEAFPLSKELLAVFLSDEEVEKLSDEDRGKKEQEAQKALVTSLDKLVEWKSHFPEDVVNAVSVLAHAVGYGDAPEGEGEKNKGKTITCSKCETENALGTEKCSKCEEVFKIEIPDEGSSAKAVEGAVGKVKELMDAFSSALGKLQEDLASKMLRAAKGEAVQFDGISIELEVEEGVKTVIPAAEFIALLQEVIPEVIQEGVKDAA